MWQTSTLNLKERRLVSVSHSNPTSTLYKAGEVTFSKFCFVVNLLQVATWEVHPENPNWTLFTVVGTLELGKFFWKYGIAY